MFDFATPTTSDTGRVEGLAEIPRFLVDHFGVQRCFVYLADEKLRAGDGDIAKRLLVEANEELEDLRRELKKGEEAVDKLTGVWPTRQAEWHELAQSLEEAARAERSRKEIIRCWMSTMEHFNCANVKFRGKDMEAQGGLGTWPGCCEQVE